MIWRACFIFILLGASGLFGGDPISIATRLADMKLSYIWGSSDPEQGGVDCSGFVQAVFREAYGLELPDEAGKQYLWLREHGQVWDATTRWNAKELRPGDLVFYCGTRPNDRPSPITHVMMILDATHVVGSQSAGERVNGGGIGVGIYTFKPYRPCGDPSLDLPKWRKHMMLYSYGRVIPRAIAVASNEQQTSTTHPVDNHEARN